MLLTLPDGSHRNVPDPESITQDIDQLVAPRNLGRADRPYQTGGYTEVDLGGNLTFFRAHLGEGRGVFRRRGYLEEHLADFSDGFMIYDDYEIAHNGFATDFQQSVLPVQPLSGRLYGSRLVSTDFVVAPDVGNNRLYQNTNADTPALSLVPGYTRPAGANWATCMKTIQVSGIPYLWIGYDNATTYSVQMLSNMAGNPPTSQLVPISNGFGTFGFCQTPIDGDAVQVYTLDAGGGIIKRISTNVWPGALEDGKRMMFGGYTVGMVNLDGNPDVFYVVPSDGVGLYGGGSAGNYYDPPNFRGRLLRTDLRAQYGPQEVTVQTPFVLYATAGANSIFYCDGTTHRYMTHGADVPVDRASDRPRYTGGNFTRGCCGHHRKDDRFFWTENETDALGGVSYWRRFEYDTKQRRSWPVTQRVPYARARVQAMGGPDMPVSTLAGHLIDSHVDAWTFQYQPPTGVLGASLGHVDLAGSTSGRKFNQAGIRYSPTLRSRNHPQGRIVVTQLIAPPLADIRLGSGTEPDLVPSEAYSRITFSDQTTFEVHANELGDHRTVLNFPDNDSWVSEFFWAITSGRGTTGASAERYSPNGAVWTICGYIYEPPQVQPSPNYRGWGGEDAAPANMIDMLA